MLYDFLLMGNLYVGISGWPQPRGVAKSTGVFDPKGVMGKSAFKFYPRHFKTVEINPTFYNPASPDMLFATAPAGVKGSLFRKRRHSYESKR
jgi:hypothetical protein